MVYENEDKDVSDISYDSKVQIIDQKIHEVVQMKVLFSLYWFHLKFALINYAMSDLSGHIHRSLIEFQ